MKWKNRITENLKVSYPIIQAPMYGVATPEMVAAANKAGCLGSLPLGNLSAEKCIEVIRKTKQLTNEPFATNIFVNKNPKITTELKQKYFKTKQFIEELASKNKLEVRLPEFDDIHITDYHEQLDVIIKEDCKILSFTFGNLTKENIEKLKQNNTTLIGTCTSIEEAKILENSGIDIICVQGFEAGGHRGSFESDDIPKIGGFSLLPKIRDLVKNPLIYAGGIYDAKTLLAAKQLGADAYQVGSLLLGSAESALYNFQKDRLGTVNENEIIVTKSFSGRYARGIRNKFIETIEHSEYILPYPYQNKLTAILRKQAKDNSNLDFVSIWLGQSISNFSSKSTTDILYDLIEKVEQSYR